MLQRMLSTKDRSDLPMRARLPMRDYSVQTLAAASRSPWRKLGMVLAATQQPLASQGEARWRFNKELAVELAKRLYLCLEW
jgi:hypothetical protein